MPIDFDHPSLILPENDLVVYRYLDLDKFERLLKDQALFFCRADKFSDPFEASTPRIEATYRFLEQRRRDEQFSRNLTTEEQFQKGHEIGLLHKRFKRSLIVNCWHINKGESDAMWRLYLKTNEGVAIQSTVSMLIEAFENNPELIYISKVRYIDYENEAYYHRTEYPQSSYNLITSIVHKRLAFQHESELRLFQQIEGAVDNVNFWDNTDNYMGKNVTCNTDKLIQKVILPPTADSNVKQKISALMKLYGLQREIEISKLNSTPQY